MRLKKILKYMKIKDLDITKINYKKCYSMIFRITFCFVLVVIAIRTATLVANAGVMEMMGGPSSFNNLSGDSRYLNNQYRYNYYLDIKTLGVTEWFDAGTNFIANFFWEIAVFITYGLLVAFNLAFSMDMANMFSSFMDTIMMALKVKIFDNYVILAITIGLVSVVISLALRNVTKVMTRLLYMACIVALAVGVANYSGTIVSTMTQISKEIGAGSIVAMNNDQDTNNQIANISGSLWRNLVHTPWLDLEGKNKLSPQQTDEILRLDRESEDRQKLIDNINKNDKTLFHDEVGPGRIVPTFVYLIVNGIKMIVMLAIAIFSIVFQLITIFLVFLLMFILLLSMIPSFGGSAILVKWAKQVLANQVGIVLASMLLGLLIKVDEVVATYVSSQLTYGWLAITVIQVAIYAGVVWQRERLLEILKDIQSAVSGGQRPVIDFVGPTGSSPSGDNQDGSSSNGGQRGSNNGAQGDTSNGGQGTSNDGSQGSNSGLYGNTGFGSMNWSRPANQTLPNRSSEPGNFGNGASSETLSYDPNSYKPSSEDVYVEPNGYTVYDDIGAGNGNGKPYGNVSPTNESGEKLTPYLLNEPESKSENSGDKGNLNRNQKHIDGLDGRNQLGDQQDKIKVGNSIQGKDGVNESNKEKIQDVEWEHVQDNIEPIEHSANTISDEYNPIQQTKIANSNHEQWNSDEEVAASTEEGFYSKDNSSGSLVVTREEIEDYRLNGFNDEVIESSDHSFAEDKKLELYTDSNLVERNEKGQIQEQKIDDSSNEKFKDTEIKTKEFNNEFSTSKIINSGISENIQDAEDRDNVSTGEKINSSSEKHEKNIERKGTKPNVIEGSMDMIKNNLVNVNRRQTDTIESNSVNGNTSNAKNISTQRKLEERKIDTSPKKDNKISTEDRASLFGGSINGKKNM